MKLHESNMIHALVILKSKGWNTLIFRLKAMCARQYNQNFISNIMLSKCPKSKLCSSQKIWNCMKAICSARLLPWMSEQAGKGKGHQSQREFVHIQRGKQPPKCPISKLKYKNAWKCINRYEKIKCVKQNNQKETFNH